MARGSDSTRRRFLASGALVGAGALAGCTGRGDSGGGTNDPKGSGDTNATSGGNATAGEKENPYSVSMAPIGKVTFESVPETWVANNGSWADMGVALGLEPPEALWLTSRYHTQYYDSIPGVAVNKSEMVPLYQDSVSKELFYELDGDIHVMDPNFLLNRFEGWKRADVDEIEENVAPFFGNSIYAQHYP
jgi:iron complex transport system substrate-binding protein